MVTLGYWKIRGLRQPIVYCLEFAGADYKEELYDLKADGEGKYNFTTSYSESRWGAEDKPKSECEFPNLPYLLDGEVKVTQMLAIMGYVCRKYNVLVPKADNKSTTKLEMMNGVIGDWRSAFVRLCYSPPSDDALEKFAAEGLKQWSEKFEKFFSDNKFCVGDDLTYADLNLFELLDSQRELIDQNCFKEYPKLSEFIQRIEDLPKIKAYRESERFFKRPVNNLSAKYH